MSDKIKYGFRDMRTAAELAIGAAPPLSRDAAPPASKPGKKGVLGKVTAAAKMTGAGFAAAKIAIQAREDNVAFSLSLTSAAKDFAQAGTALQRGHTSIRDSAVFASASVGENAFYGAADLVQFSGMSVGNISVAAAASFSVKLSQRQARIAAMAGQFAALAAAAVTIGVIIKENRKRTPYPLDDDIDRPSLPRLAMGGAAAQLDLTLKDKRKLLVVGVSIAAGAPAFWNRLLTSTRDPLKSFKTLPGFHADLNMVFTDKRGGASAGGNWSEPPSPYAAQFPFNNVRQTESGHVEEWDDTPGAERIHIFHRSGSFVEMHPDGKVVYKSMSHGYQISMGDYNVKVKGDCNFSVDGNATIHAKGEVNVQGDENINIETKKDFNVYAENINLRAKKTAKVDGRLIDLRYAKLPGVPVMTMQGPAVRILQGEIERDYPLMGKKMKAEETLRKAHIAAKCSTILATHIPSMTAAAAVPGVATGGVVSPNQRIATAAQAAKAVKDQIDMIQVLSGLLPPVGGSLTVPTDYAPDLPEYDPSVPVNPQTPTKPRTNPLGNPLIYHATTQAAMDYRDLLFDTPDEVQDDTQYQAHMDTRKALKDLPENLGPALQGNRTTPISVHTAPAQLPLVDYLTRADYRGTTTFTSNTTLGGTLFTVGLLADTLSHPDVTVFVDKKEPVIDETAGYVSPTGATAESPYEPPTPEVPPEVTLVPSVTPDVPWGIG